MRKVHKVTAVGIGIVLAGIGLQASESGEALFAKKCGVCHKTERPADISTLVAPPLPGVAMHVKMKYPERQNAIAFIKDYVIHPTRAKAQCMPATIQRFGLMPSQKGNVSEEELERIAAYIVDNYPDKKFIQMHRQQRGQGMQGQKGGMNKKQNSPFLIHKGLPHLSKLLMQRWDDPSLGLSDEQKTKLLPIRKETVAGVREYKPRIMKLENEIVSEVLNGADPAKLKEKVEELSRLKKELTMIHLRCIHNTRQVLTPVQFQALTGVGQKGGCGAKR